MYFCTEVKTMIKTITKISRIEINVQHALLCVIMNTHQTRHQASELMCWTLNYLQRATEGLVKMFALLYLMDGYIIYVFLSYV